MRSRSALIALLAFLLGLLGSPGTLMAADPSASPGDSVLRVGVTDEPNTASVLQCCSHALELVLGYDQLVGKDALGQPVPAFATSWSVSADGLAWTFKIRPGMTWSDGQPADANDAAFSFTYLLDSLKSDAAICGMWCVYDFSDYVTGAVAQDPQTLVVTLSKPTSFPLTGRFYVIPKHIFKDVKFADLATFGAEGPIVGTGPFILKEWVHGQFQRLVRNDAYWGGKPAVSEILIQFYKSPEATIAALKAGEIDFTDSVGLASVKDLAGDPAITLVDAPWSYFTPLVFNTRGAKAGEGYPGGPKGPGASTDTLADQAFRDALGYAIDHQALVDKVLDGHGKPGLGPVAPSDTVNWTGLPGTARAFDTAAAKAKLEAAGYKDGNGDGNREDKSGKELNLNLLVQSDQPNNALAAQFITEWFGQAGVKVTLTALDAGAVGDKVYGNNFDLTIGSYMPNINNRFDYFAPNAGDAGWVNADYSTLIASLKSTTDPAARKDLTAKLDALIYVQSPMILLFYPNMLQAYRTDRFSGWDKMGAPATAVTSFDLFSAPLFAGLAPVVAAPTAAPTEAPTAAATPAPAATAAPAAGGGNAGGSGALPAAILGLVAVAVAALLLIRRRARKGV